MPNRKPKPNKDLEIAIVVPLHIQPTAKWIEALIIAADRGDADVIVVDDSTNQNIALTLPLQWKVYNREAQAKELGKAYEDFKIFHKSSACRNFGNYMAWKLEYDVIVGLDSDCNVPSEFVEWHLEALRVRACGWTNPLEALDNWFPRGYPYSERNRRTVANLGLWSHVLDINAQDRIEAALSKRKEPLQSRCNVHTVAQCYLPFSGMNWAMWRDAMPGFLFLPNFDLVLDRVTKDVYKFRRHDDIWGGYIFQKLMEKKNERVVYGFPIVYHATHIDAPVDAKEERAMLEFENTFYSAVDEAISKVEPNTYEDMMLQFAKIVKEDWKDTEWDALIAPIRFWADLFNK